MIADVVAENFHCYCIMDSAEGDYMHEIHCASSELLEGTMSQVIHSDG